MNTIKKTARVAGVLYLLFALISIVSFLYIPSTVIVPGDATATASNLGSSELLFRLGILGSYISQILFVFLVLTFYRLFKETNHAQALLMVVLVAIGVAATFVNMFHRLAALILVSGADFLAVFTKAELDALAYAFLRLYSHGAQAIEVFWGLWLFPFGLLVYKSGFIPKILGGLLMMAGVGYVLSSVMSLVLPEYKAALSQLISVLEMGELPIIFWLLIVGAQAQGSDSFQGAVGRAEHGGEAGRQSLA